MSFPVVCVSNVYTQMLVCICLYNVYYNNMMIAAFWSGRTVFVVFLFFLTWRNIDRRVNQICLCPPVCLRCTAMCLVPSGSKLLSQRIASPWAL